MKKQLHDIRQFDLSPLAKAGVFIINIQSQRSEDEHDVATPHRDTHYLLMMATQGHVKLSLDFDDLSIAAPAMLLVVPGQIHYVLAVDQPQGWAISFDPSLVDSEFQLVLERGFKGPMLLDPQTAFYHQVITLLGLIEHLQSGIPDAYTGRSTHALLAALLSLLAGKISTPAPDTKLKETRGELIERRFSQLLKQQYKVWKQPAQYAAALAISVAHLNDTVKGITGNSVSAHIQQQSILEAKRLLYFTKLSVKQIGYELGYDEPVYFGKLFKKITNVTPLQFRAQFRD